MSRHDRDVTVGDIADRDEMTLIVLVVGVSVTGRIPVPVIERYRVEIKIKKIKRGK